jgi:hypothetical protein
MEFRKWIFLIITISLGFAPDMSGQSSFYLNHGDLKECKFTSDAIYLLSNNDILDKTDYNGNTIWSKTIGANPRNVTVTGNAIYYFLYYNLVKLDTSGNFIWAKDLSVPVCITSIFLTGLAVNDNHIYVSFNGGWNLRSGMLVYDTSGVLLNTWCDQTGNDNYILEGFPRRTNGAWFKFFDSGTGVSYTWLVQVDSMGNLIPNYNSIDLDGGISQDVVDVILLPDSTYLSVNRTSDSWGWFPWGYHIDLTNFTEAGIVNWKRSYSSQIKAMYPGSAGVDSLGNLYFLGQMTDDISWSYFILKMDAAGNILHSSELTGLPWAYTNLYSRMTYRNGKMYVPFSNTINAGVLAIDTSMILSCGIVQSSYVFDTINTAINYFPWFNYTTVNYVNTPDTINLVQQLASVTNDLCILLSSGENHLQTDINVFPNPSINYFQISSDADNAQIEIYNTLGKICLQKPVSKFPVTVDVHEFPREIYFLRIQTQDGSSVRKIVIQ